MCSRGHPELIDDFAVHLVCNVFIPAAVFTPSPNTNGSLVPTCNPHLGCNLPRHERTSFPTVCLKTQASSGGVRTDRPQGTRLPSGFDPDGVNITPRMNTQVVMAWELRAYLVLTM